MKITSLSLDSQLTILAQLPSYTLLSTVPLICVQWYRLQPHVCLQRRTLKLAIQPSLKLSAAFKASPAQFTLYPKPLDDSYVDSLVATFPKVTHLIYIFTPSRLKASNERLYNQQLQLLQRWTSSLVSFELFTLGEQGQANPEYRAFFDRLVTVLALIPRLKHLTVLTIGELPPSIDLGIIGRLPDVTLNFAKSDQLVVSKLLQHCSSAKLPQQRLSLGIVTHFLSFAPLFTSPQICSKIYRLRVNHLDCTQFGLIIDHCSNLKALHIGCSMNYFQYMHLLTKLPHLTELSFCFKQIFTSHAPSSTPLPVLTSIRMLTSCFFCFDSHDQPPFLLTAGHFPQLQVLNLYKHDRCPQCVDTDHCLSLLLQPLADMATLTAVKVFQKIDDLVEYPSVDWLPRIRKCARRGQLGD